MVDRGGEKDDGKVILFIGRLVDDRCRHTEKERLMGPGEEKVGMVETAAGG